MDTCFTPKIPFCILLRQMLLRLYYHGVSLILPNSTATASDTSLTGNRLLVKQQAEQILTDYGNHILRYAYSYLHNMSDAEEILQDTLVQFLKTAPVFESKEHEKAWLLRVAGNLSKNRIKYNTLRSTDELQENLAAAQKEDLSFVWEAVKSLPVKYREVIHLFYYEDYSTRQIAAILHKPEATIRSDLHRGRARLKELLKEEYDCEETIS